MTRINRILKDNVRCSRETEYALVIDQFRNINSIFPLIFDKPYLRCSCIVASVDSIPASVPNYVAISRYTRYNFS